MLEWLWDAIGRPTLEALGFVSPISDDNWPRVWWIPTGPLNHLPLHAAGQHADGSTETVLDRVMSSYTSSIKALIYGRGHRVRNSEGPASSDHAVLVAMPETPGLPPDRRLKIAGEEVKMLEDLCKSLQLKSIQPGRWKEDVLRHLRSCKIFHFAGHGQTDPEDPSQSYLLLNDWKDNPLTVGDLRDCRLQESQPFLGYLSACSTGANEAHRLADEGIHLISAFQLAGFRHVVGTLWEV
jgi:CHAT domain-containing protein